MKILGLFLSIMTLSTFASADICNTNWLAVADGFDVTAFINAGVDPNGICANHPNNNRPLHQALMTPRVDSSVIEALISNGARVNIRNLDGDTPFNLAEERFARVSNLPENSAQYLREEAVYNAVMGSMESDQFTAATDAHNQLCDLGWWRSSASGPAVEGLLAIPEVDVDHRCPNGDRIVQGPLRLTSFSILPENVFWGIKELVDAGADLTARNDQGESAESLAGIRYDQVHRRITNAQVRWCRDKHTVASNQQLENEVTQNKFDTSVYLSITSGGSEELYQQLGDRMLMELYRLDVGETKNVSRELLCSARGVSAR